MVPADSPDHPLDLDSVLVIRLDLLGDQFGPADTRQTNQSLDIFSPVYKVSKAASCFNYRVKQFVSLQAEQRRLSVNLPVSDSTYTHRLQTALRSDPLEH